MRYPSQIAASRRDDTYVAPSDPETGWEIWHAIHVVFAKLDSTLVVEELGCDRLSADSYGGLHSCSTCIYHTDHRVRFGADEIAEMTVEDWALLCSNCKQISDNSITATTRSAVRALRRWAELDGADTLEELIEAAGWLMYAAQHVGQTLGAALRVLLDAQVAKVHAVSCDPDVLWAAIDVHVDGYGQKLCVGPLTRAADALPFWAPADELDERLPTHIKTLGALAADPRQFETVNHNGNTLTALHAPSGLYRDASGCVLTTPITPATAETFWGLRSSGYQPDEAARLAAEIGGCVIAASRPDRPAGGSSVVDGVRVDTRQERSELVAHH